MLFGVGFVYASCFRCPKSLNFLQMLHNNMMEFHWALKQYIIKPKDTDFDCCNRRELANVRETHDSPTSLPHKYTPLNIKGEKLPVRKTSTDDYTKELYHLVLSNI